MAQAISFVSQQFLDEKHYRKMHQDLSRSWCSMNSLSAAMQLMEQYGVKLTEEEMSQISGMDEGSQISFMIGKMPTQSNDQFQKFFLQLQLLVSTATRVRQGLEAGQADCVEEALDDADASGVAKFISRMAIVQA